MDASRPRPAPTAPASAALVLVVVLALAAAPAAALADPGGPEARRVGYVAARVTPDGAQVVDHGTRTMAAAAEDNRSDCTARAPLAYRCTGETIHVSDVFLLGIRFGYDTVTLDPLRAHQVVDGDVAVTFECRFGTPHVFTALRLGLFDCRFENAPGAFQTDAHVRADMPLTGVGTFGGYLEV